MQEKTCTQCGETKPLADFYTYLRRDALRGGERKPTGACKACIKLMVWERHERGDDRPGARKRWTTRPFEHNGQRRPLAEWAERLGLPYARLPGRLAKGWAFETAVTVPFGRRA